MLRLVALILVACSSDKPVDVTHLGDPCAPDGHCPTGTVCVHYTGLGGEFESCEIQCAEDPAVCPSRTTCVTIADGPGAVCRPN